MKTHDVQSITIEAGPDKAFDYIETPENLPLWTNAFQSVDKDKAVMGTPAGNVPVTLEVKSSRENGTIDWYMHFPDGNLARAYSRLTPENDTSLTFSFVLLAPPAPLEELEGALAQQSQILSQELGKLKEILEA